MNNLLDLTMRLCIFKLSDSPLCFFNNCFWNQIWHFLICYHRPPFLAFPNNQVVKFLNVLITYCFSLNWKIITPRNDTVLCSWIYIRSIVLFSSYYSSMLCLNNLLRDITKVKKIEKEKLFNHKREWLSIKEELLIKIVV